MGSRSGGSGPMAVDQLVLSDQRHQAHKRMWAAVNLKFFGNKYDWSDEERNDLADMLGLTKEMLWVTPPRQQPT